MMLLSAAFDPWRRLGVEPLRRSAIGAIAILMSLVAAGLLIQTHGGFLGALGRGMASGAGHGGLLFTGWLMAGHGAWLLGSVTTASVVVFVASVVSSFTPWGALLYLLSPFLLFFKGADPYAPESVGQRMRAGIRHMAVGLAAGAFLGIHLLISASLTLGYAVRVLGLGQYLAAVAYDVGANALTAEWLFRGALFAGWWQRLEFWPAASLSTALLMGRYLVDPALPQAVEVRAGAVFYVALLGLSACALRAWSGSLVPGYLATVAFFASYRMLAP